MVLWGKFGLLFAETSPGIGAPDTAFSLLLPIGILILFYFILWRPMQRQEKDRKALLGNLKKNDKILTNAGIYGTVVGINETEDELTLKVDDNTRIRVTKSSVNRNFTNEENSAKANAKPAS